MKKKILFVVNPISGTGPRLQIKKLVDDYIDHSKYDPEIIFTQRRHHAVEISKEAALAHIPIVVAVGGDGSVNETGQGLIGSETALGIIPAGSGNGLANHLKIPKKLREAFMILNEGNITKIDTLQINDKICLGIAGIGFDAHVAHVFSTQKTRGLATYCKVIFKEYGKFKPIEFDLEINGKEYRKQALLATFANSSQYGNMAAISPLADIKDGMLEVCILHKMPLYRILHFMYKLFNNSANTSRHLEIIKTSHLKVSNYENKVLHIDGEPFEIGRNFEIKVNPLSLKVIVPEHLNKFHV